MHQLRDIFPPLSQCRNLERKDIEPVEEIHPEQALLHPLLQIVMSGGDQPNVHLDTVTAADAFKLLLLNNP